MRKITQRATESFLNRKPIKLGNTRVRVGHLTLDGNGREVKTSPVTSSTLILHGHTIAEFNFIGRSLWFTLAGWNTPTTKERLNGLFDTMGLTVKIVQRNFVLYLETPTESVEIDANGWYAIGGKGSKVEDFQGPAKPRNSYIDEDGEEVLTQWGEAMKYLDEHAKQEKIFHYSEENRNG